MMRTRQTAKVNGRAETRRPPKKLAGTEPNDSSPTGDREVLIAKLTELHGRSSEVVRRVMDDARILADVQRETSAVLLQLWNLPSEAPRPAPAESPSASVMSASSTAPSTQPRFLRFRELAKRVGLSRSSVWRLERAGLFPQHRRLSSNAVGWWEPEIEVWLRARPER